MDLSHRHSKDTLEDLAALCSILGHLWVAGPLWEVQWEVLWVDLWVGLWEDQWEDRCTHLDSVLKWPLDGLVCCSTTEEDRCTDALVQCNAEW